MAERESAKTPRGYYDTTDAGKKYGKGSESGHHKVLVGAMTLPTIMMLLIGLVKCVAGG